MKLNFLKDFIGVFKVIKFIDLKIEMKFVFLRGIEFINVEMKVFYELFDLSGEIIGGCFLENEDIILVDYYFN